VLGAAQVGNSHHVGRCAGSIRGYADFALIGFGECDELGNGFCGNRRIYGQDKGQTSTLVRYRGAGPELTDLLGGQIQVGFLDMAGSIEYIRAGKLRALAVTTATRSEALPDIPTIGEVVPVGWSQCAQEHAVRNHR
jgi:Tripartite tricarboxylate transporter family receptor